MPVRYTSAAAKAEPPFQWDDEIIATTDPSQGDAVTALRLDPRDKENPPPDYFEYRRLCRNWPVSR